MLRPGTAPCAGCMEHCGCGTGALLPLRPNAADGATCSCPTVLLGLNQGCQGGQVLPCLLERAALSADKFFLKAHTRNPRAVEHLYVSANVANPKNSSPAQHAALGGMPPAVLADKITVM